MKDRGGRPRPSPRRRAGKAVKEHDAAQVVDSLRRLFRAIQEHSKAILGRTGISGPQVWALTILGREPGLSLGELAERLFAHPSTVSGIVDRLEARGAARRVTDPDDARGLRLFLTPAGRRLLRKSPPPFQHGLRHALEALSAARLRSLRQGLDEVVRATAADKVVAPFCEVGAPHRRKR